MIIKNGIPVEEYFYSDFAEETRQYPDIYTTSYMLHVYDDSMVSTYHPGIDGDIVYKRFMSNVLGQIALDGVAIVLVTNNFGKCIYIIASDN